MSDLGIPEWTNTNEDFIKWHRNMLESEEVSSKLHKWIDLNFGYLVELIFKNAKVFNYILAYGSRSYKSI